MYPFFDVFQDFRRITFRFSKFITRNHKPKLVLILQLWKHRNSSCHSGTHLTPTRKLACKPRSHTLTAYGFVNLVMLDSPWDRTLTEVQSNAGKIRASKRCLGTSLKAGAIGRNTIHLTSLLALAQSRTCTMHRKPDLQFQKRSYF